MEVGVFVLMEPLLFVRGAVVAKHLEFLIVNAQGFVSTNAFLANLIELQSELVRGSCNIAKLFKVFLVFR